MAEKNSVKTEQHQTYIKKIEVLLPPFPSGNFEDEFCNLPYYLSAMSKSGRVRIQMGKKWTGFFIGHQFFSETIYLPVHISSFWTQWDLLTRSYKASLSCRLKVALTKGEKISTLHTRLVSSDFLRYKTNFKQVNKKHLWVFLHGVTDTFS